MDVTSVVSLAGAVISAASAIIVVVLGRRAAIRDRRLAFDELAERYRVPLLHAAFNLQSRMYNIGQMNFLKTFLTDGTEAESEYARYNIVYLIAQYLCWAEIIRRETQFLEPLNRQRDREVMTTMEAIRDVMADSRTYSDALLRIFRGDQRAIGEVMLAPADSSDTRSGPRWDCIGYAAFVNALTDEQQQIARWVRPMLSDVSALAEKPQARLARLVALQNALIQLLDILDPDGQRIPINIRLKLEVQLSAAVPPVGL
jgi:hypothetical protein